MEHLQHLELMVAPQGSWRGDERISVAVRRGAPATGVASEAGVDMAGRQLQEVIRRREEVSSFQTGTELGDNEISGDVDSWPDK